MTSSESTILPEIFLPVTKMSFAVLLLYSIIKLRIIDFKQYTTVIVIIDKVSTINFIWIIAMKKERNTSEYHRLPFHLSITRES